MQGKPVNQIGLARPCGDFHATAALENFSPRGLIGFRDVERSPFFRRQSGKTGAKGLANNLARTLPDHEGRGRGIDHRGAKQEAILLFHTPLENLVLVDAMGLKPALRDYCAPALKFAFLMSAAWAFSALCRGLLAGGRNTTMLALTGAVRIGFAAAIAATTLAVPTANGAVIGLIGWMAGYTAEAVVLALVLKKLTAPVNQSSR